MHRKALFFLGMLSLVSSDALAGAVAEMQKRQQQMMQQAAEQQMMQQRQQAIAQAEQQMMQQRQQAVQQAQQKAMVQRQQQVLQQQMLEQRQQMVTQAAANQMAQHQAQQKAAAQSQAIAQAQYQQAQTQAAQLQLMSSLPNTLSLPSNVNPDEVQDVKTLADIWRLLETSSQAWALMIELEPKIITVQRQIAIYRDQGVVISKEPMHYVQMIDDISSQNPGLLVKPFKDVLRFVAIVEYDFNDGKDIDTVARQLLGEEGYLANRQRLGL